MKKQKLFLTTDVYRPGTDIIMYRAGTGLTAPMCFELYEVIGECELLVNEVDRFGRILSKGTVYVNEENFG